MIEDKCSECGGTNLVFQGGCTLCIDCGNSSCSVGWCMPNNKIKKIGKNKKNKKGIQKSEKTKLEEKITSISQKILEKKQLRAWIRRLKVGQKCLQCPEDDPITLEFHHRNPTKKIAGIGEMISKGYSKDVIREEIKKCDLLCANCHKKAEQKLLAHKLKKRNE